MAGIDEVLHDIASFAVSVYRGCAPDMGEHDLDAAVDFVADNLHDRFGSGFDYRAIAKEALQPYFGE
jgi:hypothetical protein